MRSSPSSARSKSRFRLACLLAATLSVGAAAIGTSTYTPRPDPVGRPGIAEATRAELRELMLEPPHASNALTRARKFENQKLDVEIRSIRRQLELGSSGIGSGASKNGQALGAREQIEVLEQLRHVADGEATEGVER